MSNPQRIIWRERRRSAFCEAAIWGAETRHQMAVGNSDMARHCGEAAARAAGKAISLAGPNWRDWISESRTRAD